MKKVSVLLFGVFLFVGWNAFAQDCGDNRQFSVPAGVGSPGEYADSIRTTFAELQKLNPSLTEKNFRAGSPICVPIKSDAHWAELEKDKATWDIKMKTLSTERDDARKKVEILELRLGQALSGWYFGAGALGALVLALWIVGRKLYLRTHRNAGRKTLLNEPTFIAVMRQRILRSRESRRRI